MGTMKLGGAGLLTESKKPPACQPSAKTWSMPENGFLVSKETVVLRQWEGSKQKFGFIKQVDKGSIATVKGLES